jgi:hypothetical protein
MAAIHHLIAQVADERLRCARPQPAIQQLLLFSTAAQLDNLFDGAR